MSLLKLQRGPLSIVVRIIISTHARRIRLGPLANDFCRSGRDEEGQMTVSHPLGTPGSLPEEKEVLGSLQH